ncbi:VanZ family protein [Bacillus sp. OTU530]|uniref:VanZ family protein n=1 Tax=Bacillus sp. OTU530 TaxID=3043862 RepID=UPI00313D4C63
MLQLITLAGVFDIDDIILNVAGALLGYSIWKVFRKFRIAKQTKSPIHTKKPQASCLRFFSSSPLDQISLSLNHPGS